MQPSFVTDPVPATPRGPMALMSDALRRPGGRRSLSVLWIVLLLSGMGMFAYPFATDVWTKKYQSKLNGAFDSAELREQYRLRKIKIGDGLTKLTIPKIGLKVVVVEGSTPAALRAGAGHYLGTPLPGEKGNVGIAGHRTTYGRPFNRLDELGPGDIATLETPFAVYTYTAVESFDGKANPHPVLPTETHVLDQPAEGYYLTLTTCHPKGSDAQRLILRLALTKTVNKDIVTKKK